MKRNRLRALAGIVNEAAINYRERLEAQNYHVTQDEYVSHRHLLDKTIPLEKSLREIASDFYRQGYLTSEQSETLMAALSVLRELSVPLALLRVKKEPDIDLF